VPVLTGVVGAALDIILVAVMSVYLLIDGKRVVNGLRQNMPAAARRIRFLLDTLQRVVGGYIRGQLALCGLIGLLVGPAWKSWGALCPLTGGARFVLEFIPVLGTLVSGLICVLLALTKGWLLAIIVLVYFVVVHVIEGDVVGPRIVGKAIGLHPVVSLAALIAGVNSLAFGAHCLPRQWQASSGIARCHLVRMARDTPHEFQAMKDRPLNR